MESRYDDEEAKAFRERYAAAGEDLALRVYTSRLLGADPSLVLHGGGNTSVKSRAREITGEEIEVLYVKGSGWDLSTIEPRGFPACRLEALRRCCNLPTLSDEDMVAALRSQMLDPSSPTPSVEALLHAFLPAKFVDHTHADAVLAVVDQPDSLDHARAIWGESLLFVPYVMPGFVLARRIVELGDAIARSSVMVLDKHGIFTWGDTARQSYERMIEAVSAAERYVAERTRPTVFMDIMGAESRRERQRRLSPILRGAVEKAADGQKMVLSWRSDPTILALLDSDGAVTLTRIGPITPDHVIRTKAFPAWFGTAPDDPTEAARAADEALRDFAASYEKYFAENSSRSRVPLTRLDRLPRLFAVRGLGVAALGKTLRDAEVAGELYAHTAQVILDAWAVGSYRPVSPGDLFDVEYWSLEQAKLKVQKSSGGPLSRHIALVTGAARGIGRATAEHFLALGAHVMLSDRDEEALGQASRELAERHGSSVAAFAADVTEPGSVDALFDAAVDAFGGLDVVVSNAGNAPSGLLHSDAGHTALLASLEVNLLSHQLVAKSATRLFLAQGTGGAILFNASKSAFNPGPDFGPYAVPKAAVVALMRQYAVDLGKHGIRSNAVNADRIHTRLFDDALVERRAKARGISPEEYFQQNLLGRETTAEDVARAFGYLATAEATTGCVVTVDGGNAAAFVR